MADSDEASVNGGEGKKRKYLPHGKPVRKGLYPLRPGVQGFFLTCDGGRERQATNEALNLLEDVRSSSPLNWVPPRFYIKVNCIYVALKIRAFSSYFCVCFLAFVVA
ncbi:uncharacterized protein LOC121989807 [Zingiber officinale]|uniref:uncharacterized protein LOC121989807 n=1 Tax=Zingiber officinale TaxID=94328 RepID=UPI001C4ABE92|nr:uncharacterized protein LOC121989807 [Zingiber officinale]